MCGDYDSVIGFNKENSLKKFQRDKDAIKNFPANGPGTISGLIVTADTKTGLAKNTSLIKFEISKTKMSKSKSFFLKPFFIIF